MTTRALAEFTSRLRFRDLPASTTARARDLLLDGIGCLLAGTTADPGRSAATFVHALSSDSMQATIFVTRSRGTVRDAAFVNGMTLYSVGVNDIHKPSVSHPGGCIIPVVLAVGEWKDIPGPELIAGMCVGYEVMGRVGRCITPSHRERGFHPTGTLGTFGAAAAAARLFEFDAGQVANTLGIAGSQAAGLFEFHSNGTNTMIFHAARAAQNGVEAAMLTTAGLTGPATVLEGEKGFCRSVADRFDERFLTDNLGESYEIEATSFRPYYGCSSTIAASGAAAQIMRRLGRCEPKEVEKITVHCNPVVAKDNCDPNPMTLLAARLSMQFNLALVLARGDVHSGDLRVDDLHDARIRSNLHKIGLVADQDMPRFGATVTIKLTNGRSEEAAVLQPRGDASNPLTWDDVVEKFCRITKDVVTAEGRMKVVELLSRVESVTGKDIAETVRNALLQRASRGE